MKNLLMVALGLSLTTNVAAQSNPQSAIALTKQQNAVWQGEVDYWKYVNRRDVNAYATLWHPEFTGWPCGAEHPADLAGLKRFAAEWFSEMAKAGQSTIPQVEAVVVDKEFAITYLSARTVWTDGNGKKQSKLEKFVHTWKATDGGWKIIGGMCAPLERQTPRVEPAK